MEISELPLPAEVKTILKGSGYTTLYPTQAEAVRKGALEGRSLVLASPTASGKTLVAELCALKEVLEREGKVAYLTPLRALASEKFEELKKYERLKKPSGEKVRVALSTGDYDGSDPYLARYDIIVSTNEKVDSLIRHRARWLRELTLVIADEIHLLQDASRGPTLEVALTRLRRINPALRVVALSATVKNPEEVAAWLGAELVTSGWRPVPLREGVAFRDEVYFNDGSSLRLNQQHPNTAVNLALKTISDGGQALIFAETRKVSVSLAQKAAAHVKSFLSRREKRLLSSLADALLSAGERTRLSETLSSLVEKGVAFHHAGVPSAHRKLVEDAFRSGRIKLVCATPTLAAGVNLPARMVIVNSHLRYEPGYGRLEIPVFEYKQMAGRAGRPRFDELGEAILVAGSEEELEALMEAYVCAEPERVWSKLASEAMLRTHTLATVAAGFAHSEESLLDFFYGTFYAHQYGRSIITQPLSRVLNYLAENELLHYERRGLKVTEFGRRVSELYIDPESAVIIRAGLGRSEDSVSEIGLLHLICHTPDISPKLYPTRREVEELQLFLEEHQHELLFEPAAPPGGQVEYESFLGEIKCVEVLSWWIEETREDEILEHFRVEPGDLYRLVETADWLLYSTYELAKLFGRRDLLDKIAALRTRVKHGVKAELLPLISLEGVGRVRARALYDSGYRDLEGLRRASPADLLKVPGIGAEIAKKIKSQVGGLIRKEEMELLKSERSEQTTLREFDG